MFATEQQVLEDFGTGKFRKQYKDACEKTLPFFRGKRNDALLTPDPTEPLLKSMDAAGSL